MQIQSIPFEQLLPAPYNPRQTIQPGDPVWKKLERSLREFDLVQPVVWNERTGHVVSGHQRLAILKHRGETAVECVVVDLSLDREKALNITLNNSEVGSDWDPARLVDLISELRDLPDFDATLTGFDDQQLADLIFAPALEEDDETQLDSDDSRNLQVVTLETPREQWPEVEGALNQLLADFPEVRVHMGRV